MDPEGPETASCVVENSWFWVANRVPLHDNLGEDYSDNQREVDRAYLDKSGVG